MTSAFLGGHAKFPSPYGEIVSESGTIPFLSLALQFPSPYGEIVSESAIKGIFLNFFLRRFHPLTGKQFRKEQIKNQGFAGFLVSIPLRGNSFGKTRSKRLRWTSSVSIPLRGNSFGKLHFGELLYRRKVSIPLRGNSFGKGDATDLKEKIVKFPSPYGEIVSESTVETQMNGHSPLVFPSPYGEIVSERNDQQRPLSALAHQYVTSFHPLTGKQFRKASLQNNFQRRQRVSIPLRGNSFGKVLHERFK